MASNGPEFNGADYSNLNWFQWCVAVMKERVGVSLPPSVEGGIEGEVEVCISEARGAGGLSLVCFNFFRRCHKGSRC